MMIHYNFKALQETQKNPGSTPYVFTDQRYCEVNGLPPEWAHNKELLKTHFISQQPNFEEGLAKYNTALARNGLLDTEGT